MIKKILIILIFCGLIFGCAPETEKESISKKFSDQFIYFQDDRTNLCFVYLTRGGVGFGIAEVPCDKVKHMIKY